MDCAALAERLSAVGTHWRAVVVLLEAWRADLPAVPAREGDYGSYAKWAALEEQVVRWFDARVVAPRDGALMDDEREQIVGWVESSDLGMDAVEAVAWGLDVASSPSFAKAWRDELCAGGGSRHVLSEGDPYPVPEPQWPLPADTGPTARPGSQSPAAVGELPHVRVHSHQGFKIVADFGFEAELKAVGAGLDLVAALHPNEDRDEFKFTWANEYVVFPVEAKPQDQEQRVVDLVRGALRKGARLVVLPELSTTPDIVEAIGALVDECDDQRLVVAGSYHTGSEGDARNESLGLLPENPERLRHLKMVPFSDELRVGRSWREGIAIAEVPEITIYHAGRFRFCLLTCKDFLDHVGVGRAIERVGANVICVPAMSEKTDTFEGRAGGHVAGSQAVVVVANGPLRWEGACASPAAVLGQPVRGAMTVPGTPSSAPAFTLFKFGTDAVEIEE
jgi:hypothetical protein